MADLRTVTATAVTVIVIPAAIDRTNAGLIGREDVDSAPALLPRFWIGIGVGSVAWVRA
jgi:hypothetical protein